MNYYVNEGDDMNKIKIIIFILIFALSLCLVFKIYNNNKIIYSTYITQADLNDTEKIDETESPSNGNEEETPKDDSEKTSENNSNTTSSDNKVINKQSNSDSSDNNTEEVIEEEINNTKHICSSSDNEYITWLNNYLSINSSTRVFDTLELAKSYGDSQMTNYGYGYFYSKHPITFEGDKCTKKIYTLQLYIPSDTCGNNEMLYLPNNINVIHSISYLRSIGYSCPEKVVKN